MTDIDIQPLVDEAYGVEVTEGTTTTNHKVTVPGWLLEELGLEETPPEEVLRESFRYMLEREPSTSILQEFSLDDIAAYFPEYFEDLKERLSS
jgi:hypothetical protein